MLEVFRGDEGWADELSESESKILIWSCAHQGFPRGVLVQLEPPMPVYLFNLVAALREKNAKGYPVKKV